MSDLKNYTLSNYTLSNPVGHWVMCAQTTPCVAFSMYHKPTRLQIWFTELLLGWKWRDA